MYCRPKQFWLFTGLFNNNFQGKICTHKNQMRVLREVIQVEHSGNKKNNRNDRCNDVKKFWRRKNALVLFFDDSGVQKHTFNDDNEEEEELCTKGIKLWSKEERHETHCSQKWWWSSSWILFQGVLMKIIFLIIFMKIFNFLILKQKSFKFFGLFKKASKIKNFIFVKIFKNLLDCITLRRSCYKKNINAHKLK
jgi:hypothetical protein